MKETPWWYRFLWMLGIIIFKLMFGLEIEGRGKIPLKGAAVLAANHRSYLDPVVLALTTPRRINFIAKEELFQNPLFGKIITSLGAFPLKREKMDKSAYKKAIQILREGRILALFPEGTRSISGKLGNLKGGFIRIAIHCRVPVIPVVIRGTEKALPPGKKCVKLKKIRVKVGEPVKIYSEGKEKDKIVQNLLQDLRKKMIAMGANR